MLLLLVPASCSMVGGGSRVNVLESSSMFGYRSFGYFFFSICQLSLRHGEARDARNRGEGVCGQRNVRSREGRKFFSLPASSLGCLLHSSGQAWMREGSM